MTTLTLDQWLGKVYQADIKLQGATMVAEFKAAIAADPDLAAAAQERLKQLNALVAKRGERACAYSAKYRNFLQQVFS